MPKKEKKIIDMPVEGEKKKRVFRSKEERLDSIEKKLKFHRSCIQELEKKKAAIERGRSGGAGRAKSLKRLISDAKLSDAELIEVMTLGDEEKIRARLNEIIEKKSKGTNDVVGTSEIESMSDGEGMGEGEPMVSEEV